MIAPPQKNLGAGDEWGRWVEQELGVTDKSSVQVSQGVFGRLFDYGSLIVSGGGTPQAPISSAKDVSNHLK